MPEKQSKLLIELTSLGVLYKHVDKDISLR